MISEKWYAYIFSSWVEITDYVITRYNVTVSHGMATNKHTDRLAKVGLMSMLMDNQSGLFDPQLISCMAGWNVGTKIKLEVIYEGTAYVRFKGSITSIVYADPSIYDHAVKVTVSDWLRNLYNYPVVSSQIQTNKTGDVAISEIISGIVQTPEATSLDVGANVYPTIFDTVTPTTKGSAEVNKIVLSEASPTGGYFYEKCDSVYGETIVFENAHNRNGLRIIKSITQSLSDADYLTDEDGAILTDENGVILKLYDVDSAIFNGSHIKSFDRTYGDTVCNRMIVTAYPKKKDASNVTLYTLDSPVFLPINQTIIIRGKYTNPSGGNTINADTTGLSSTYTAFTNEDGTGTNISPNVAAVVVYGSDAPIFEITNNSAYSGYLITLVTTGKGYYQYNSQDVVLEDSESQNDFGINELSIQQQYQRDTNSGTLVGSYILDFEKDAHGNLNKITFDTKTPFITMAFININEGDLIRIQEPTLEIDSCYYIQGINFTVYSGGNIVFTWILKQTFSLMAGLSMAACSFSGTAALNFGVVPPAINNNLMSIYAEVYPTSISTTEIMTIISTKGFFGTSQCGYELYIKNTTGEVVFTQVYATGSVWITNLTITPNQVNRILVLIDSTQATPVPVIYLNGVLCTVSIPGGVSAASGALVDQSGGILYVGNSAFQQSPYNYITPFLGKVKALRIYDDLLSSDDIALANAGTRVTTDLVFEAPCIRTRDITKYSGLTLTEPNKLVDNIYGYIGTPHGSPVSTIEPFIPDQGLSFVDLEFPGTTGTGLDFGFVSEVSNLPLRSFAAWVYPHTSLADNAVISIGGDSSNGARLSMYYKGIKLFQYGTGGVGIWQAYYETSPHVPIITLNAWNHIVVARDSSSPTNQPVMYVNGLSKTVTELTAQSGATATETKSLCIGNTPVMTSYFDGLIRDARIYNKILDSTEAADLASGIDVTSGLVFRGMAVRTDYLSKYADKTLNSNDILYESTTGFIPKITGGPIVTRLP